MNNYKLLASQAQLVNRYKNTRSKIHAWYNYQTNKGVLTEWFCTKLLQHIGMNNYKSR